MAVPAYGDTHGMNIDSEDLKDLVSAGGGVGAVAARAGMTPRAIRHALSSATVAWPVADRIATAAGADIADDIVLPCDALPDWALGRARDVLTFDPAWPLVAP
jgi:hypothetical protein